MNEGPGEDWGELGRRDHGAESHVGECKLAPAIWRMQVQCFWGQREVKNNVDFRVIF